MTCRCDHCDRCRTPLTEEDGHEHLYVGDAEDNLRLSLCHACLADLTRKIDLWRRERP